MDLSWTEIHWSDPSGGTVLLHGVLPTVVLPRRLWPRVEWHGICLPASSDEVEIWEEEEKYELEDPGVNLQSALLGGGITGIYLDELLEITDLQVGRFPDPEPRRLHRAAVANDRPVFFAEPDLDDELWVEHITAEAKEMTKILRLLSMIRVGGSWRRKFKRIKSKSEIPDLPEGQSLQHASALAATWWAMILARSSDELNDEKDSRYAARIRGALAELRKTNGNDAVLMVPITQGWRSSILEHLQNGVKPEEVSCLLPSSQGEEE